MEIERIISFMGLLRRRTRKPKWEVVPPYPWGEPLPPPGGQLQTDSEKAALVAESGDWFWLGVSLNPGEQQVGRCSVYIYQASAEGKLFLTDQAMYLGYDQTAKKFPLNDVRMFAVDPADYGEVALATYFPEIRDVVPTHLRVLDVAAFARFYPTARQLILATRSPAVLGHESLLSKRAEHAREVHEWLSKQLRPGETIFTEAWVSATSALGEGRAEYWVVTNQRWFRSTGADMYGTDRADGLLVKATDALQHQYEFLTRARNGPWGRTAMIEPLISPMTGPDDRWWEFFETLFAQSSSN